MAERILIVEDEPEFADLVELWMGRAGYGTTVARTGTDALRRFYDDHPDLVILDVSLPGLDGWQIIERIREFSRIPILLVTARSSETDKIRGLKLGADDYIHKPFSQRLLIERVKALLRRAGVEGLEPEAAAGEGAGKAIKRGKLSMDPARHECTWDGKPVKLTVTEFLLLQALAQRPGFVKSRDNLMDAAYDDQVYVDDRTIDSHIKRLRKKFKVTDDDFDMIETLYGVGYRFKEG